MTAAAKIARVLVGVDFDDASAAALKMAGAIAASYGAEMTLFHAAALDMPAYFTGAQIVELEAERERSRAVIARRVRAFAAEHLSSGVSVAIGEGRPQDAILRMARAFDVIVVGAHRRHGPRGWWLGSVAEAVVRRAPRPVLVVPACADVIETRQTATILAAGDDGDAADPWVEVLRATFGGDVVRSIDIYECAPERLKNTSLIVLSMPPDGDPHSQFGALVQVLKDCIHPVLFVPSVDEIVERSSS